MTVFDAVLTSPWRVVLEVFSKEVELCLERVSTVQIGLTGVTARPTGQARPQGNPTKLGSGTPWGILWSDGVNRDY